MNPSHPQRLTSIVFRLTRERLDALKALSRSTRIRQSEYLREAIADILTKHQAPPVPSPPHS
jgi:hypothetical protein